MKILIDTNILLDVLCDRKNFVKNSAIVFKLCEAKRVEGAICSLSVANIVYIMRKELTAKKIENIYNMLSIIFKIEDLKDGDIKAAIKTDFKDFEDALQIACAERINTDYIVTRNLKDFENSSIKAITPEELMNIIRK